jgi:hypothetical protein
MEGEPKCLILDTVSCISIHKPGVSKSEIEATNLLPHGVKGEGLAVKGRPSLPFVIGGHRLHHTFLVSPLPTEAAGLLGADFLAEFGAVVDLQHDKLIITNVSTAPRVSREKPNECATLTIFVKGKEGHSPQPSPEKARHKDEQSPAGPPL